MSDASLAALGFMGGTFNPVHHGHLRVAVEFAEYFNLTAVNLLPCYQPVHRGMPTVNAQQRLAMLQLAVTNADVLHIDSREIRRLGPSFSVDSLREIRQEYGADRPIYFAMGSDAFNAIESWQNWQEIFELCNIVVMHRPDAALLIDNDFIRQRLTKFTGQHVPAGHVYELLVSELSISSTYIRQQLQAAKSVQYLLPSSVENYIHTHQLYN